MPTYARSISNRAFHQGGRSLGPMRRMCSCAMWPFCIWGGCAFAMRSLVGLSINRGMVRLVTGWKHQHSFSAGPCLGWMIWQSIFPTVLNFVVEFMLMQRRTRAL